MDDWDSMQMEFVSKGLKMMEKAAKATVVLALVYASCGNYSQADYRSRPNIRSVAAHYFEHGVVAFTKPEEGEIAMPPIEFVPYENGVHSWRFVLDHELMHNYIHKAGGIQDERGINAHVRAKLGYSRDPFPSY